MVAIAVADVTYFIIPDLLVLAALGLGLLQALLFQSENFLAATAGPVLRGLTIAIAFWSLRKAYKWLRGREGIGLAMSSSRGRRRVAGLAGDDLRGRNRCFGSASDGRYP